MHHYWSTIQNGIQFLYKVCMKLRREYIGNIILHLAEFGMKALDIWQSTLLLIFESPQMGLGGKDPGAGDEVELFKQWTTQIQIQIQNWRQGWVGRSRSWRWGGTIPNHPPHTDPPSLICYTFPTFTNILFTPACSFVCMRVLYSSSYVNQKKAKIFCSVLDTTCNGHCVRASEGIEQCARVSERLIHLESPPPAFLSTPSAPNVPANVPIMSPKQPPTSPPLMSGLSTAKNCPRQIVHPPIVSASKCPLLHFLH